MIIVSYLLFIIVDLVQSATLFRKAAGVYHSIAIKVLSEYDRVSPSDRPPEATSNVCSVMSLVCLAEAQVRGCQFVYVFKAQHFLQVNHPIFKFNIANLLQAVTIRKAEEKGNTTSLLAKLHYGIVQMLDEAMIIIHKANKDRKDISTGFLVSVQSLESFTEVPSLLQ